MDNQVRAALVRAGKAAGFRGRSLQRFLRATGERLSAYRQDGGDVGLTAAAERLAEFIREHGRQA